MDQKTLELVTNLEQLDTANAMLTKIIADEDVKQEFSTEEKQEVYAFVQEKLSSVKKTIDEMSPEELRGFNEVISEEAVDNLFDSSFDNLQQFDGGLYATYIAPMAAYFSGLWASISSKLGLSTTQATSDPNQQGDSSTSYEMMPTPTPPPVAASSPSQKSSAEITADVPEPKAGKNYTEKPQATQQRPRPSTSQEKIKQATRPISTPGGTQYFVRTGFNRYVPASQADLDSGQQLFMKNPNPALRAVYPYVKVESMIKKARRATPA